MSSHSHIETAQAMSDVALIAVHRDQFGLLIERNAPVALKIIQQFSKTLRYLDAALARLTLKGDSSEENVSHLFGVAEYYAKQSQYNQAYYAYYKYIQHCPDGEHVQTARERMGKIKPYAKAVYLDGAGEKFTRSYPQNTMIFSESEPGAELFIIQKGSVKITKIINDNEVLLALLKAGDMFGEMALLEDKPRTASAIAHEDAVLLAVNKANFRRMVSTQPQMITRLTQILSERLWFIYKQIANTQISDPVGRMYDRLFIELERLRVPLNNQPYTFDFGPSELINLVGLPKQEGNAHIRKLFEGSKLRVIDNKIHVTEVAEIEKQSKYFAKMEKIEKSRRQASLRHQ
jgi:CRP-like cAMP-binding protein